MKLRSLITWPALLLALAAPALADGPVESAAQRLRGLYQAGDLQAAAALVAQEPALQDGSQARGVQVDCVFKSRPEGATLTVRRQGARGALAVSFPPGSYGAVNPSRSQERYGRLFQDIMFLRAPVVVLREGQSEASVVVPVACGTFRRRGPDPGMPYELHRVAADSDIQRLLTLVCSGEAPPPECETALAIWVSREGLGYDYLKQRPSFHSFATLRPVTVEQGPAARELLERAGVDAGALPFFREGPQPKARPKAKSHEAPKPRARTDGIS